MTISHPHRYDRRTVLRAAAVLGGTTALVAARPFGTAAAQAPARAAEPVVTDLGTAAEAMSFGNGIRIGAEIWFATRQVSPTKVAAYDLDAGAVTKTAVIPGGEGVWGADAVGTDLYVSTYSPALLYKIDTLTMDVTEVLALGQTVGWTVKAGPDGSVFVGTYPDALLWEYDPATGTSTDHGRMHDAETYVRDIAVTETTVYCGIGAHAHLVAYDRASAARTDLLPAELADRTFVATFTQLGTVLGAGMSPTGDLLVIDTADPSRYEIVPVPNNTFVTAITGTGEDMWLGTRPTGTVFHYRLWSGEVTPVATPVAEASAMRMGMLDDGRVWSVQNANGVVLDPQEGSFEILDLSSPDLQPLPERPQSLATDGTKVFVGGTGGLQVHPDMDPSSTPSFRLTLGGEAKDMVIADDTLYMGLYTLARFAAMPLNGTEAAEIGRIDPQFQQTRPHAITHDHRRRLLVMGTEPDYGRWEGALSLYHLDSGEIETFRGVIADQSIHAVQIAPRGVFLGGDIVNGFGTTPTAEAAELAYFDYGDRRVHWSFVPVPDGTRILDLTLVGQVLAGTTIEGHLFGVDVRDQRVLWTVRIGSRGGRIARIGDRIYATDGDAVVSARIGRAEPRVQTIVDGLAQEWFGTPQVVATPDGALITTQGTNLIRIDLP
ncbi:hypothetical protein [Haloactinopolyspora sp.]|uniref:hypothetical protein n=1 Tax=Haloactinopolyspora sp. TaxID=1966353 RepID=UPI002639B917|nr:hypothetical protein [Haloactinopolyspora sp.]